MSSLIYGDKDYSDSTEARANGFYHNGIMAKINKALQVVESQILLNE